MRHFDIFAKFLEMYPQFHEQIQYWAPNGFHKIAVWLKSGQAFIFTYFSDNDWDLVRQCKPSINDYIGRYAR